MTTAFVLSGGGSLGAVQVGMLQALGERGVEPDLLVGTSAGAINAAFVGGHGMGAEALEELAGLWRSLRRRNLFALRPLHGVLAVAGVRPSLFSAEPLRRLVEANLGYRDLLDARIELHLVSTDHRCRGGPAGADAVDPATAHRRGRAICRTRQAQGPTAAMPPEGLRGRLQPRRRADRQSQEGHGVVAR